MRRMNADHCDQKAVAHQASSVAIGELAPGSSIDVWQPLLYQNGFMPLIRLGEGACDMTDTNKRDFNLDAATWNDNPMRVKLADAVASAILSRVPVTNTMNLMDYGAGTGLVTLGLQPHVGSVVAADSAQGMLDRLNEKIAASRLTNVETLLLDLENETAPEML